jgi:multidrug efflux pump subunit AcrB
VRRLKPILMTSLTTILALVPLLWGDDIGSQLQRPMAVTLIGGMTIGTLVSLYVIPLFFYYVQRLKARRANPQDNKSSRNLT